MRSAASEQDILTWLVTGIHGFGRRNRRAWRRRADLPSRHSVARESDRQRPRSNRCWSIAQRGLPVIWSPAGCLFGRSACVGDAV